MSRVRLSIVWLNILAATALIKVLPQGRFLILMRWYRNVFWLVLIMTTLPFMVEQVRTGLYPQLEKPWQGIEMPDPRYGDMAGNVAEAPAPQAMSEMKEKALRKSMPSRYSSAYPDTAVDFERIDPKAKVQTGPGLPQWEWNKVMLSWNGSVDAQQQLHLWYLSPTMTMLLNFIRVALVGLLALLMFGVAEKFRFKSVPTDDNLAAVVFAVADAVHAVSKRLCRYSGQSRTGRTKKQTAGKTAGTGLFAELCPDFADENDDYQ